MGMFMRDLPPPLDLEGRKPSARRRVIVASLTIIAGSTLAVALVLGVTYLKNQQLLNEPFKQSPLLRSQLNRIPNGIDVAAFAQKAESSLTILADSIADLYSDKRHRTRISVPGRQELPFASNEAIVRALGDQKSPYSMKTVPVSDGHQTVLVAQAIQYHIANPFAPLLEPHFATNGSVVDTSWVRLTATMLADWQLSFPDDPRTRSRRDSVMEGLHIPPWVLPANMIAHLYCALKLPCDAKALTQFAGAIAGKKQSLIGELWEDYQPSDAVSFAKLSKTTQDSLLRAFLLPYDTVPFLLLGTPGAPLPRAYDCTRRPWFIDAVQVDSPVWSSSYDDAGTGIPVTTLSVPIKRIRGGQDETIGVLAVDFFTRRLADYPKPGSAYLLNFLFVLTASVLLLAIIVGSSRRRFDLVLWATSTLVLLYAVKVAVWATNAGEKYLGPWSEYPDFFLSMVSSMSFILAALVVFKDFRHGLEEEEPPSGSQSPGAIARVLQSLHILPDNYATAILSAVVAATVLACLDKVLAPVLRMGDFGLLAWMDALVSAIALVLFGFYFTIWARRYFQWWFVYLSFCSFLLYGTSQLAHPLFSMYSKYWYALALTKALPLFSVVAAIYLWTRFRNFDRVRRTGTRATILSRIGVPYSFVTIAGTLDADDQFLFVDRSTLRLLGWVPESTAAIESYASNQIIEGWERSELGDDLYVPKNQCLHITDIFADGYWASLKGTLLAKPVGVTISKDLNDHRTFRTTHVKMLSDTEVILSGKSAGEIGVRIVSMTAWKDIDFDKERLPHIPARKSTWYFVLFAETSAHLQKAIIARRSRDAAG